MYIQLNSGLNVFFGFKDYQGIEFKQYNGKISINNPIFISNCVKRIPVNCFDK